MNTETQQVGVVLVNLGTPEAATPEAVRAFLAEFLSDQRVIDLPRWLWWPILHGIILRRRPARVAENYAPLWQHWGDSPLRIITQRQEQALQSRLEQATPGGYRVAHAFTYGQPSLARVLEGFYASGIRKVLVLPLYPQFSWTTTGSVLDQLEVQQTRWPDMRIDCVKDYADVPAYQSALLASVQAFWQQHGQADRLLMSFHGVPERYISKGDPYQQQCLFTAKCLGQALGLQEPQYRAAFQSRFGKAEWIKPYTVEVLKQWAAEGVKTVDVVCPSFSADCLETLEEIAVECAELFCEAGGERLRLIPCLNDSVNHISMMQTIVMEKLPFSV
ncbi:MAG: ferrochelatase [Gammaproteobacteria bacterium]|nr:MAG: ferrochelatase [Gammaproteobacteria bacterium]